MLASTNPLISQGTLNRLLGSVQFVNFPGLNVTASYLGKEGINLRRVTDATDVMDTMTGLVVSPAPYVHVEVMVHLLRTQSLAALFEAQMQLTTQLGQIVVRPDSLVHPPYPLSNAVLRTVEPFKFDGTDPSYNVTILGIYYVNSQLWP